MATEPVTVSELPESQVTQKLRAAKEAQAAQVNAQAQPPQPQPEPKVVEKVVEKVPENIDKLIQAKVEEARQQEKAKLYDKINRADAALNENADLKQANAKLIQENANLKHQPAPQAQAGDNKEPVIDQDALIKATVEATTAKFAAERNELVGQVQSLQDQINKQNLNGIRAQVIAEAKGKIVEELVTGDTEEAIRLSAVTAMKAYENIVAQVGATSVQAQPGTSAPPPAQAQMVPQTMPATPVQQPQPAAAPVVSPGPTNTNFEPSVGNESARFSEDVRNMSNEEYAAKRMTIRRELQRLHPTDTNAVMQG